MNDIEFEKLRYVLIKSSQRDIQASEKMLKDVLKKVNSIRPGLSQAGILTELSDHLYENERYAEGLELLTNALRSHPFNLDLQAKYANYLERLSQLAERVGLTQPGSILFRELYQLLMDRGDVSMVMQVMAAQHFELSGETERAQQLKAILEKVFPYFQRMNAGGAL